MALKLVEVEQPIKNAIEIIGEYCSRHDCYDCPLAIFEYECLTNKDPDKWWKYLKVDLKAELQTETKIETQNSNVISVYDGVSEAVRCAMCSNPNKSDRGCDGACSYDEKLYKRIMDAIDESRVDTPQRERSE